MKRVVDVSESAGGSEKAKADSGPSKGGTRQPGNLLSDEEMYQDPLFYKTKSDAESGDSKPQTEDPSVYASGPYRSYAHADEATVRPDVGVQDQFYAVREPKQYRYDSSLAPELVWDENAEREFAEWLLNPCGRVRGTRRGCGLCPAAAMERERARCSGPATSAWPGCAA